MPEFVELLASREVASILRSGRRNPWKEDTVADDVMSEYVGVEEGPELLASARSFGAALVDRLQAQLSPKGVELFELLFAQERDVADVAGALGMSMDAVYAWRSRIARAARQIARDLQGEVDRAAAPADAHVGLR